MMTRNDGLLASECAKVGSETVPGAVKYGNSLLLLLDVEGLECDVGEDVPTVPSEAYRSSLSLESADAPEAVVETSTCTDITFVSLLRLPTVSNPLTSVRRYRGRLALALDTIVDFWILESAEKWERSHVKPG